MKNSHIAWTNHTFNHVMGCAMVSDECAHCYAKDSMPVKMQGIPWGKGKPRKRTSEEYWLDPIRWNAEAAKAGRRDRVFCASLADVFDPDIRITDTADLFDLIARTPALDWLILTKRIERWQPTMAMVAGDTGNKGSELASKWIAGQAPDNVWLGVSMGREKYADRLSTLCDIPAKIRFISNEPALERIDWHKCFKKLSAAGLAIPDWLITGGESGKLARDYHVEWGMELVGVCREWGVTPFFKQTGSRAFANALDGFKRDKEGRIVLNHAKGGDPEEWPEWLRVQELPVPRSANSIGC